MWKGISVDFDLNEGLKFLTFEDGEWRELTDSDVTESVMNSFEGLRDSIDEFSDSEEDAVSVPEDDGVSDYCLVQFRGGGIRGLNGTYWTTILAVPDFNPAYVHDKDMYNTLSFNDGQLSGISPDSIFSIREMSKEEFDHYKDKGLHLVI